MAKTYQELKNKVREEAIEWQRDFENHNLLVGACRLG